MEKQAGEKLGETVIQTTIVSPKGFGKKFMTAGIAGQLGGVVGAMAASRATKTTEPALLGELTRNQMVLALTETRLAFFAMKQGLLKNSVGDLLAECQRSDIISFESGGGTLTAAVTITLADGTVIELESPRVHKGKTERIARALSGE